MRKPNITVIFLLLLIVMTAVSACSPASNAPAIAPIAPVAPNTGGTDRLNVVATTTLVGDVVRIVGGDNVDVTVLIPPDVDEHGFEPTPQDIARVAQSDLVFINGAGLEGFIEKLVQNAGDQQPMVSVSEGITLQEGCEHEEEQAGEAGHEGGDPHVWTDPNNVLIWVDNIEKSLTEADPANAAAYQKNAEAYRQQLKELDAWIQEQVQQIPQEQRKLVTDHTIFTYFASRYGFEQVGAVVPGYSTLSSPSAQQLAALEDAIKDLNVPAIFVGNTVNPAAAERVSKDTQTELVHILTGSLTNQDGLAPTYLEYVRYNVQVIVGALR